MLDSAHFPRLAEYASHLPQGLDSHPDCLSKGAAFRLSFEDKPLVDHPSLPPQLRRYVGHPPSQSEWLPSVHMWAELLAIVDQHRMSEAQFLHWGHDVLLRLWRAPLRVLVPMLAPGTIVSMGSWLLGSFHKRLKLQVDPRAGREGVLVTLSYPPGLLDRFCVAALLNAFEVALEMGGRPPRSRSLVVSCTETSAQGKIFWAPQ